MLVCLTYKSVEVLYHMCILHLEASSWRPAFTFLPILVSSQKCVLLFSILQASLQSCGTAATGHRLTALCCTRKILICSHSQMQEEQCRASLLWLPTTVKPLSITAAMHPPPFQIPPTKGTYQSGNQCTLLPHSAPGRSSASDPQSQWLLCWGSLKGCPTHSHSGLQGHCLGEDRGAVGASACPPLQFTCTQTHCTDQFFLSLVKSGSHSSLTKMCKPQEVPAMAWTLVCCRPAPAPATKGMEGQAHTEGGLCTSLPGTETKNLTASRWPWKQSCAWAMEQ